MKKFNKAIASLLVMLMLISSVMFSLAACDNSSGNGNGGGNNNGGGGNNGGNTAVKETYSVTVVTKGGMALAKLPIYIYEYEDGSLGDMVEDGGYAATDANGTATFKLEKGKQYAAKIDISLPDGYDAESFYPLVAKDTTITVSSAVISESSLVGVSYTTGAVMHDFTVNSTVLVEDEEGRLVFENQVFTLSEALKDKKAVLINFWYTTCSWCVTEFPYMQKAYENYADDVAIIALDPYSDDTLAAIKTFQSEMGLTFNVAQDLLGLANAFGVTGYPTSVMVDRYGVITLIESGAITSERAFNLLFDYYTADDYQQKIISNVNEIVPKEKPDVQMPSAEEFGNAFEQDDLGDLNYHNDEKDEYSWPFIIGQIEDNGEIIDCVYPSNSYKEASYAQLLFDVDLKVGDVLAFD